MATLRQSAGFLRSLAIYYSRPHRIGRFARFYGQFLSPGDLAFDIGGHVGNRTLALARTGARVVTLEPQEAFFRFLRRSMPASVTVLQAAAGPAAAQATMALSSLHPTVSSLNLGIGEAVRGDRGFRHVDWDRTTTVEVTTLDRLIERFGMPRFVKIDVEGYEDEVLAGLSRPVGAIAFEFVPSMRAVALRSLDRLASLGPYEFNLVHGERPRFASPDWLGAEAMAGVLKAMDAGQRSGDVYARLAGEPS